MQIEPSVESFAKRYAQGEAQVVWTTLVSDLETPVSAFLKIAEGKPMSFLLESVEGGDTRGRHSIIGLEPDLIWRASGAAAEINRAARTKQDQFTACPQPPLDALRALIAESRIELPNSLPPMAAGLFGYLGYDMVRQVEHLPAINPDPLGIPDAIMVRPTLIIVFDSVKDTITIITPVRPQAGVDAKAAFARAGERLSTIVDSLDRHIDKSLREEERGQISVEPASNTSPAEYKNMTLRAKEYIGAGDIFQVVLSQRFEAPFTLSPFALYRALRRTNPSPIRRPISII
jgi:anthranilate synthase component 1